MLHGGESRKVVGDLLYGVGRLVGMVLVRNMQELLAHLGMLVVRPTH
jgi:hypothetical protein